jgi:hypothetical protein
VAEYLVSVLVQNYGVATVEAESLSEAYQLAQDLTAADFDYANGSEEWREVKPA